MLYLVEPFPSKSYFCLWSVEAAFITAKKTSGSGGDSQHSHVYGRDKVRIDESSSCISAKTFQQDSLFAVYQQRKMVVGRGPDVSSEASHQAAGRQSISLAPPPLSRLLVPSVSINVDSCQSQRESMSKKKILKNPIMPLLWLTAVWMIGYVESERLLSGLLAPCLIQPPFCAHPTPCRALPSLFTVSLCFFNVIHFLHSCHWLLHSCLRGVQLPLRGGVGDRYLLSPAKLLHHRCDAP